MTLEELIASFKRGESTKAMNFVFKEYGVYCIKNVQLNTRCSEDEAKEVFTDALLNLRDKALNGKFKHLEAAEASSPQKSLRSYLYNTCLNMQRSEMRKHQRLLTHKKAIQYHFYDTVDSEPFDLDYHGQYGEDLLEVCYETLGNLGNKCRELLRYFYINKLTITQITEKMGYANSNVAKTAKSRCMKEWREMIVQRQKEMDEE